MFNFAILSLSLILSFANLLIVRFLFDDPQIILEIRSLLVVGLMASPLSILGLDTIIGKIKPKLIAQLSSIFIILCILLTIIANLVDFYILNVALLALTVGTKQFVVADFLNKGNNTAFKILSQITPKILLLISILSSSLLFEDKGKFITINSLLYINFCLIIVNKNIASLANFKHITKSDVINLANLSLKGLAALFITDLFLRIPYLASINGPATISNEFDIATAFTSSWILPLSIATRITEVQSGYHYQTYKNLIQNLRLGLTWQISTLILVSMVTLYILTSFSFISETFTGVMTAMVFTGWPAILIITFPNITRMYFLSEQHRFSSSLGTITTLLLICATLTATVITRSQPVLSCMLLLIILFMHFALKSEKQTQG